METIQRFVSRQCTDLLQKRSSQRLKPFSIDSNEFCIEEEDEEYENNFEYKNDFVLNERTKPQKSRLRFVPSFRSNKSKNQLNAQTVCNNITNDSKSFPNFYVAEKKFLNLYIDTTQSLYSYDINHSKKFVFIIIF